MKSKIVLSILAGVLALGILTPATAKADHGSAGYFVTRLVGYDHCGRPVYQRIWIPVYVPQPRQFCPPSYDAFRFRGAPAPSFYGHHRHCR